MYWMQRLTDPISGNGLIYGIRSKKVSRRCGVSAWVGGSIRTSREIQGLSKDGAALWGEC